MKTLIATLVVSTFALTGASFAEKANTADNAQVEASSTNSFASGLTNEDINNLFYDQND